MHDSVLMESPLAAGEREREREMMWWKVGMEREGVGMEGGGSVINNCTSLSDSAVSM